MTTSVIIKPVDFFMLITLLKELSMEFIDFVINNIEYSACLQEDGKVILANSNWAPLTHNDLSNDLGITEYQNLESFYLDYPDVSFTPKPDISIFNIFQTRTFMSIVLWFVR